MALTLNSTLSDPDAESYVSVATADAYHLKRSGNAAWSAIADEDDKIRALIGATDLLERLAYWGTKTESTQALKVPRRYLSASNGLSIPREVEHAVCELALHVSSTSNTSAQARRASLQAQGVTSYRLGEYSESYGATGTGAVSGTAGTMGEMPAGVQRLLHGWVKTMANSDSGRRSPSSYDSNGLWWPEEMR